MRKRNQIKKFVATIIAVILILGIVAPLLLVNAESVNNDPSIWAVEDVNNAIQKEIVPNELQMNYKNNIKRYEYVLLAMKILEKKHIQVHIVRNFPFEDTFKHPYEKIIVKAYNAGIIKGDGLGSFRPDANISRQEIAVLVTNLISVMKKADVTKNVGQVQLSDFDDIGDWALPSTTYCFNRGILKGTGKDVNGGIIFSPRGNATIEQAILMLYRVANDEAIFDKPDLGTVKIKNPDYIATDALSTPKIESQLINDLASNMGEETGKYIKLIADNQTATVSSISEEKVEIDFSSGKITVEKNSLMTKIKFETNDLTESESKIAFLAFANLFYKKDEPETTIKWVYEAFNIKETLNTTLSINKYTVVTGNKNSIDSEFNYVFTILETFN